MLFSKLFDYYIINSEDCKCVIIFNEHFFSQKMKGFASAFLLVCTVAFFSVESNAYNNKQCFTNFHDCTSTCASTCAGKGFKCKLDAENCNDKAAAVIKTCSDPSPSDSCPDVCGKVIGLLGLQDLVFGNFPAAAIANVPGSLLI